jgi:hypothetical protein
MVWEIPNDVCCAKLGNKMPARKLGTEMNRHVEGCPRHNLGWRSLQRKWTGMAIYSPVGCAPMLLSRLGESQRCTARAFPTALENHSLRTAHQTRKGPHLPQGSLIIRLRFAFHL